MSRRVLVVDDEPGIRAALGQLLEYEGYDVRTAVNATDGIGQVASWHPHLVFLDVKMAGMDGLEALKRIRESDRSVTVVMISGHATIQTAVEATQLGAYDILEKPLDTDRILVTLRNALQHVELFEENSRLRETIESRYEIVGKSYVIRALIDKIERVAATPARVLITGENGTGKELVARAIHRQSSRRDRPFVEVNCAAIPGELIESELFGHEKGSFTGASERRSGCFELAQHGTLLLDEIGEMPLPTQAKLLRILEDSKVRRLGGKTEFEVDVRLVAATNKVPDEAIRGGHLREDLFYRLNVFHIHLPPLRESKEDVAPIAEALIAGLNRKHECRVTGIAPDVLDAFERHSWPGNVRELRNVLERAVILAGEGTIELKNVPVFLHGRATMAAAAGASTTVVADDPESVRFSIGTTVEDAEKGLILRTLEHTHNNKTRAAEILGISLKTLHNKLKEYGG